MAEIEFNTTPEDVDQTIAGNLVVMGDTDVGSLDADEAQVSGDVIIDGLLRLPNSADVALGSTEHAFQIGPDNGSNLIFDLNEIQSRDNGAESGLLLNADGGNVTIGGGGGSGTYTDSINLRAETTDGRVSLTGRGDGGVLLDSLTTDGAYLRARLHVDNSTALLGKYGTTGGLNCSYEASDDGHYMHNMVGGGAGANMQIGTGGLVKEIGSIAAIKLGIEDAPTDWADKVLQLQPRTWFDKSEVEELAAYDTALENDEELPKVQPDMMKRIPGFVAEEVDAQGMEEFISRRADGSMRGLMYDRIPAALVQLCQRQQQQIDDLMARVETLEGS